MVTEYKENVLSNKRLLLISSAMEMVGKNSRTVVGVVAHGFYSIGYFVATLLAWLITSWRWLQVAMTLPALLFIPYYW